jgi:hypothetical protein
VADIEGGRRGDFLTNPVMAANISHRISTDLAQMDSDNGASFFIYAGTKVSMAMIGVADTLFLDVPQ